ncbi:GrpB family protein [Glaciecola siphonariae]|uniref:GrpB family protein n=1 Tax=Glaciecola siphonariae TaxID=521012 RepID=A0ABV9M208_9ALTE
MTVVLSKYNPDWAHMFEEEKLYLLSYLDNFVVGSIERVGSTSVQGMVAKPIIDIMCGVQTLDRSRDAISVLESAGYCYYPYKADVMHWFCKPTPDIRTHHLHLVEYESALWRDRLKFRDLLRNEPQIFEQYKSLKIELAREFGGDREVYTKRKGPFIQRVLDNADS